MDPVPSIINSVFVVDLLVNVDTPDVVTMVSTARDLSKLSTDVSPASMESISLEDFLGSVDTPDLLSRVTTDGDIYKPATNLGPVTMESMAEINLVGAGDAPDVVSGVTGDTDLLEETPNVVPFCVVNSITEVYLVCEVNSPDLTIVGNRDVLKMITFNLVPDMLSCDSILFVLHVANGLTSRF